MGNKKIYYHLIGVCGSSMSGIASYLIASGSKVTGSDIKRCKISDHNFSLEHDIKNINQKIDFVVKTSAITIGSAGWKELQEANRLRIPILKRSELIGKILHDKISIGVAGMHGKTTASAMIVKILNDARLYPGFLIGSETIDLKSNWGISKSVRPDKKYAPKDIIKNGKANYFVAEACEYDRSFLDMRPKIGVILNIDREHLDYYKEGMPEIKQAFKKYIKQIPKNGLLFVNQDDGNLMSLIKSAKCKVKRVTVNRPWPGVKLKIPGKHNLFNATIAAKVAHELGVDHKTIKKSLNSFSGTKRRFEVIGVKNGITVLDDYGHNPVEIKSTIQALREKYPKEKIIMVFQPHQQQRTKIMFQEFANCFKGIDKLIINDVFLIAGREKDTGENLAQKLVAEIKKKEIDTEYISDYKKIVEKLKKIAKKGDVIVTQGATDIYKVGKIFLEK